MKDKEDKKQERDFAFWGVVISLILSALSIVLVVMEQYGVTLPGIMPGIMSWSLVWLPILCGVTGVFIGWYVRDKKVQDEIKALEEQHGTELAKVERIDRPPEEDPNPRGFSKRALNAWNLMEDRDKRSLGCLAGASILNGETPVLPLVLDMDGSLVDIGLDASMVKNLERLGLLEKYPERALMPIKETDEKCPIMQGVDAYKGEAIFATAEGIYMTRGCTAQFCVPGDYASPPIQCVDLGLYCYTDIGQEILRQVNMISSPKLFCYLDAAYQKRRGAGQPFHRWETEI